jgi:group I intron endonuclease
LSIIYRATNTKTNKSYIGMTNFSLERRWKEHCKDCKKLDTYFHKSLFKYGKDSWKLDILEEDVPSDLRGFHEIYWIAFYNTYFTGYNTSLGGEYFIHTDESKLNLSLKRQGNNNPFFGKTHSDEYKTYKSSLMKGNTLRKGAKDSEETRLKKSKANKGRKLPPRDIETRKRMSEAAKNRKRKN